MKQGRDEVRIIAAPEAWSRNPERLSGPAARPGYFQGARHGMPRQPRQSAPPACFSEDVCQSRWSHVVGAKQSLTVWRNWSAMCRSCRCSSYFDFLMLFLLFFCVKASACRIFGFFRQRDFYLRPVDVGGEADDRRSTSFASRSISSCISRKSAIFISTTSDLPSSASL